MEREPGTGRVVSTLHVGEVVNVCIFTDCNCVPIYSPDWRSSDPSVASIALSPAPLTVCNDAFESARGGGADRAAELRGLRPGETQISVVVSGAEVPRDSLPIVHCPNRHNCLSIDVVRVIP